MAIDSWPIHAWTVPGFTPRANARPMDEVPPSMRWGGPLRYVVESARSLAPQLEKASWSKEGAGDEHMAVIAANFDLARGLSERYAGSIPVHSDPVARKDLEAASSRVVHTLYLAAHAVSVGLVDMAGAAPAHRRLRAPHDAPARTARWAERFTAVERVLGHYLQGGQYAEALEGEPTAPVQGLPRLEQALARFDIQAHRTLVQPPSLPNLVLMSRTQGMYSAAALVLINAAAQTDKLQPDADPRRLQSTLGASGAAWAAFARQAQDVMPSGTRLDPELASASAELRAPCREVTHHRNQLAQPELVARQIDLAAALPVLASYVEAGAELAEAIRPVISDPELQDSARGMAPDRGRSRGKASA